MEKSKIITNILALLDKATDKQILLIYMVAYEIVRKPLEK